MARARGASLAAARRQPPALRLLVGIGVALWAVVATFPLAWTALMSFRVPVDALSSRPLDVLLGPASRAAGAGLSAIDMLAGVAAMVALALLPGWLGARAASRLAPAGLVRIGWILAVLTYALLAGAVLLVALPAAAAALDRLLAPVWLLGHLAEPIVGITLEHYRAVWIEHAFYRNFENSILITLGTVAVSLTVGTLAGYGLARAGGKLSFWLLIAALVFRALPHSVLVTGYVPFFLASRDLLAPFWSAPGLGAFLHMFSAGPPTLYGQPLAVVVVLVSINQPFTIWMMRSFFDNIPRELDEAAQVDGCSHFGAFWRVIMPVMWPGVVTTGLFAFLLAYNDYLVTSLLLDAQSQTMVPAITQFLNRDTRASDQIEAIAAAVSITAPLFLLVMAFQRQIVSGLTQGAVKG